MAWVPAPKGELTDHFSWVEARCKCCGRVPSIVAVRKTATMMETLRTILGRPLHVHSWCRCPKHNAAVGGEPNSFHMKGYAVDFTAEGQTPHETRVQLEPYHGPIFGGLGRYATFSHVDRGPKREWSG